MMRSVRLSASPPPGLFTSVTVEWFVAGCWVKAGRWLPWRSLKMGSLLVNARQIRPDIDWHRGDAGSLPFGDGEFDAVVSQFTLMFVPDPVTALKEMRRVLTPGGLGEAP